MHVPSVFPWMASGPERSILPRHDLRAHERFFSTETVDANSPLAITKPPTRWPCYYRGFSRLSRALCRKKQLKRRGVGVDVIRMVINCAGNNASGLVTISGDFVASFRLLDAGDSMIDIPRCVCRGGMRSGVEFLCRNFT